MFACVKSKVGVSENKPWRLGALAVCQVHLPACVKSKVRVSENKPWRLGALAVCQVHLPPSMREIKSGGQ